MPAFWRESDRSAVGVQEAMGEWALTAWDVLEAVAVRWRRTVTADDLASEVQRRSGIHTAIDSDSWISTVLSLVAQRAHEARGPALTSLVVGPDGRALDSYREVLALEGSAALGADDLDEQARAARLAVHRAYGARVPAGTVELTHEPGPSTRTRRSTTRAAARPSAKQPTARPKVCPTCFLELPATGFCDDCG